MNQALSTIFGPIKSLYNKAFDANKYLAGIGLSIIITSGLFFIMVILISLGDSGMKEDKSIKLADVVMPERQIDTFMTEVDKRSRYSIPFFLHPSPDTMLSSIYDESDKGVLAHDFLDERLRAIKLY